MIYVFYIKTCHRLHFLTGVVYTNEFRGKFTRCHRSEENYKKAG